ncbi:MAG: calponin homology domain-containing protein [archaeon]|nr:calponin homology domain-containing protein [archaeon]
MIKPHPKKPPVYTLGGQALTVKVDSLPREVIKWIQSLDLTYSVKNVKKDFNNGFLVAQILSRYFPITNDPINNKRAIQMHQIDNGFSMARRKDNWEQIKKFLTKIPEITTKIGDVDTFIKNENGEILLFVIALYQDLTQRRVPILEGKVISTDIDNINKSFLLKDNGEIEKLKKADIDNMINSNANKVIQGLQGTAPSQPPAEASNAGQSVSGEKKEDMMMKTNSKIFLLNLF